MPTWAIRVSLVHSLRGRPGNPFREPDTAQLTTQAINHKPSSDLGLSQHTHAHHSHRRKAPVTLTKITHPPPALSDPFSPSSPSSASSASSPPLSSSNSPFPSKTTNRRTNTTPNQTSQPNLPEKKPPDQAVQSNKQQRKKRGEEKKKDVPLLRPPPRVQAHLALLRRLLPPGLADPEPVRPAAHLADHRRRGPVRGLPRAARRAAPAIWGWWVWRVWTWGAWAAWASWEGEGTGASEAVGEGGWSLRMGGLGDACFFCFPSFRSLSFPF